MYIIFDLWETVASKPYSILDKMYEKFNINISKEELRTMYESTVQRNKWNDDLIKNILFKLNIELNIENLNFMKEKIFLRGKHALFIDGMKDLIEKIKKNHNIVLFSNTSELTFNVVDEKLGLSKLFDYVICSFHLGYIKPEKEAFEGLLKKLNVKPNEVIFIDDSKINIISAEKIGIKSILFKDSEQLINNLDKILKNIA
jgi:HAD superfamily hydrolase (TIGR01509 family)